MVEFHTIFSAGHTAVAGIGMGFNVLLFYLALFQTPKAIQTYAVLIVNFAITDFFACFFDMFVQQRIIPVGWTLGYVSNGFCTHFDPTTCYVGYSLMLHFLTHSSWSLLLSFSYRCYILFYQAPSRRMLSFIIFLIYIPSFIQFFSFLWAQDDPKEIMKIFHDKFPEYNLTGATVTGTKNILCFSALYTILYIALSITPMYMGILMLRRTIIRRLSYQGTDISKETKGLHSQLLMALTYQAVLPGFFFFSVASYAIGQLGIYNHPALEYFTFSCFIFIPFLSPLASFIFVTPYRKFILGAVGRKGAVVEPRGSNTFNPYSISNK